MVIRYSSALKGLLYVASTAVLFAGGFEASRRSGLEFRVRRVTSPDSSSSYVPPYRSEVGSQLVLVYFGAAGCAGSNNPALPRAVETLKMKLAALAKQNDMRFESVGVALDWVPERGVEHLDKFGHFDEIAAGYNWGNALAIQYMWSNQEIAPTTPQLVLYRRFFTAAAKTGASRYGVSGLQVLRAAVGLTQILDWAKSGDVLPGADSLNAQRSHDSQRH